MNHSNFFRATDLKETCDLLARYGQKATVLAGGTDVMVAVNRGELEPEALVYIGDIGLKTISEGEGNITIEANVTHSEIVHSTPIQKHAPLLVEACKSIGSVAIRNAGTIAGNLGTASPAGDACTALMALNAEINTASATGGRTISIDDFFSGPKQSVLQPDELIRSVTIPSQSDRYRWAWEKLGMRKASTCAVISVAISLEMAQDRCTQARIALGAAAPVPLLAQKAGSRLEGSPLGEGLIEEVAEQAAQETAPIDDARGEAWYRSEMARTLVRRLLLRIYNAVEG